MSRHDIIKLDVYPDRAVYLCACGRVGSAQGAVGDRRRGQWANLEEKARANHYSHKRRALRGGMKATLGAPTREGQGMSKKYCGTCQGACEKGCYENRVRHPLLELVVQESLAGGWTCGSLSRAIGRSESAIRHLLVRQGARGGWSPKIDILSALLNEVGYELHWEIEREIAPNEEPLLRSHGRPSTPARLERKAPPHRLVKELKARRQALRWPMLRLELATVELDMEVTAAEVSDMETGYTANPHVTTLQILGLAMGLKLVTKAL